MLRTLEIFWIFGKTIDFKFVKSENNMDDFQAGKGEIDELRRENEELRRQLKQARHQRHPLLSGSKP